jgi:plastin-3
MALIKLFVAALIWQLMRAYTLSVLTRLANTGNPIIEKEIVQWVNNKLQGANKTSSIRSFQVRTTAEKIHPNYSLKVIAH